MNVCARAGAHYGTHDSKNYQLKSCGMMTPHPALIQLSATLTKLRLRQIREQNSFWTSKSSSNKSLPASNPTYRSMPSVSLTIQLPLTTRHDAHNGAPSLATYSR
eukprot:jgi/Botrbrau1/7884/Bobra.9_2s0058.1